ncbi:MAG: hypothetical protein ACN6RK_16265 [Stenotrophomonas sp.]
MRFFNTMTPRGCILLGLICGVLAGLLFVPGLSGSFILDDGSNIVDNPGVHLQELSVPAIQGVILSPQPGGLSRIVPTLTFALDYWRGGGEPEAFKVTNIIIHIFTVCGLVLFLRLLMLLAGMRDSVARLVALLVAVSWAVHPLQVSSVLYVVQRMQTLATLFLVLAMWSYLRGRVAQVQGGSGRRSFLICFMTALLALGCKEDAVLLPLYCLLMELTVLQFRSASPIFSRRLRNGYLVAVATGLVFYVLVIVPHYWAWGNYPGRDFSSYERLLTQARILTMHLGQIVVPLPANMPFYYDWLVPSRGLLQPVTTLASVLFITSLLAAAWWLRLRRPLFAFGILFFFASHFITSNVLNLELAFEHRNHLGLVGVLLAVADMLMAFAQRLRISPRVGLSICGVLIALMAAATAVRAHDWGSRLGLALVSSKLAPHSARAWNSLCLTYYAMGGGRLIDNPRLGDAIDACGKGAQAAPYSLTSFTNLIVFKSVRGDIRAQDWSSYLERLRSANMGPENRQSLWIIINNVRAGAKLDETGVLSALEIFSQRLQLDAGEYTAIGYFILGHSHQPEQALVYFRRAVRGAAADDPLALETIAEMRGQGRADWAAELEAQLVGDGVAPAVESADAH